jgi:hypothetical protein
MLQTIVLRFSDYNGTQTVDLHSSIIEEFGHVWWGWWKKNHEEKKTNLLNDIAGKCPLSVGIVNRDEKKYYKAECQEVIFDRMGEMLLSPESHLTPTYYQNEEVPAWLKFSSIISILEEEFRELFDSMPDGDATLFEVEERPRYKKHVKDLQVKVPECIKAPGDAILHLSDLHFGSHHAFAPQDQNHPIDEVSLATMIAKRMEDTNQKIGVVVVSGDFITGGQPAAFSEALKFLNTLAEKQTFCAYSRKP